MAFLILYCTVGVMVIDSSLLATLTLPSSVKALAKSNQNYHIIDLIPNLARTRSQIRWDAFLKYRPPITTCPALVSLKSCKTTRGLERRTFLCPLRGRRAERAERRLRHRLAPQPVRLGRRLGPRDAGARPGRGLGRRHRRLLLLLH